MDEKMNWMEVVSSQVDIPGMLVGFKTTEGTGHGSKSSNEVMVGDGPAR